MEHNTGTNTPSTNNSKNIDEILRQIFKERNYFPEGYTDDYQPPSLEDDTTERHAFNLIDEIFIGADQTAQQKICELLRNLSLSDDSRLTELVCRYAFINYTPFEDEKKFSNFMKEGRSYDAVN